jgi:hypothetical protein
MESNKEAKHKKLVSLIKTRKMKELRNNPPGTSMNGYTKNAPVRLDDGALSKRRRTLRDRKALEHQRRKKNQKLKKQPLPVNQMEEFMGMKPLDPSKTRAWDLDEAEYLRFQSASRHSVEPRHRHSADNVLRPLSLQELNLKNNNNNNNREFYEMLKKNVPQTNVHRTKGAPRFLGRYEEVPKRPPPVHRGPLKSGPRSQGRYDAESNQPKPVHARPKPIRSGTQKKKS